MTPVSVPVLVGRDAVGTWWATWDPQAAPQNELSAAAALGYPVGYWMPVVGYPGQWRWPDGSVSNTPTPPVLTQREPGGGVLSSTNAGLSWQIGPPAPPSAPSSEGGLGIFFGVAAVALVIGLWSARTTR